MPKKWFAPALAVLSLTLGLLAFEPIHVSAAPGDISDLQTGFKDFMLRAANVYRLDQIAMEEIWIAYCVENDGSEEDIDNARAKARELQNEQYKYWAPLMDEVTYWLDMASKLQQSSSGATDPEKDAAKEMYLKLLDQRGILRNLQTGVVLAGSNHSFVQFAIDYGKQAHDYMCTQFGDSATRVCDEPGWPGIGDRRPDLVAMSGGHLVVFEFKPDNKSEIEKGWDQLEDYLPAVVKYYQRYFPNGPAGATNGEVPEFGGQAMLDALANSPDTWHGNDLEAIPHLETYKVCERKF